MIKIFFFLLFFIQYSYSGEKITLLAGEWAPFVGKKLKDNGVGAQIIKRAFGKKDIKVKILFMPWEKAFNLTKKGKKGDGTFFWSKNEEREESFFYSLPIIIERNVFFHLKSKKIRWKQIKDLRKKRLGVVKGFSYGAELDLAIKKGKFKKIIFEKTTLQNFKNLLEKKIDLFPHEISVGTHELQENFPKYKYKKVINNKKDIGKDYTYLLMSKRNKKKRQRLLKIFNQSLAEMFIDGEYNEIIKELGK